MHTVRAQRNSQSVEEVALLVGGVRSVRHGVQLLLVCCSKKRQRLTPPTYELPTVPAHGLFNKQDDVGMAVAALEIRRTFSPPIFCSTYGRLVSELTY